MKYYSSKELQKEGWIRCPGPDHLVSQDEVDELVFDAWGWAHKLHVEKLLNNKYLKERAHNTNMSETMDKKHERIRQERELDELIKKNRELRRERMEMQKRK